MVDLHQPAITEADYSDLPLADGDLEQPEYDDTSNSATRLILREPTRSTHARSRSTQMLD